MQNRYSSYQLVGHNGNGSMFHAFDTKLNRKVVIKRILHLIDDNSLQTNKKILDGFSQFSPIQHPHVVIILDTWIDDEGVWVVMEYIEGQNLGGFIKDAPMKWLDFKVIAMQILDAFTAIHHMDVIHSDLEPQNIMISQKPSGGVHVKILALSLLRIGESLTHGQYDNADSNLNSLAFMPPERFSNEILDDRSDIYSIGCCLYYALTKTFPFQGETAKSLIKAHIEHDVIPLDRIRNDIPTWASEWVMWMIDRDPVDRPVNALHALTYLIEAEGKNYSNFKIEKYVDKNLTIIDRNSKEKANLPIKNNVFSSYKTILGRRSKIHEDQLLIDSENGLYVISSGVKGLLYGDRASDCVIRQLVRDISIMHPSRLKLKELIKSSHDAVCKLGAFVSPTDGIGATLALLKIYVKASQVSATFTLVGDNALFVHNPKNKSFVRITSQALLQNAGNELKLNKSNSNFKDVGSSYLGGAVMPLYEFKIVNLDLDDRIIMCSAGIALTLDDSEIEDLSNMHNTSDKFVNALTEITNIRNGRSNASAVVVQFIEWGI